MSRDPESEQSPGDLPASVATAGETNPGGGGLSKPTSQRGLRGHVLTVAAVLLAVFVLIEVNYPLWAPQTELAIFAMLGMVSCFLVFPSGRSGFAQKLPKSLLGGIDLLFIGLTVAVCLYVAVQSDARFESWFLDGVALGERAGAERPLDIVVGCVGLLVVLEAARRSVGNALPILAGIFLLYARFGPSLPDWLFPHRGYGEARIVSQAFLHSQGVFGIALNVMFKYVFLFVVFGALLEATGAIGFVIASAQRIFRNSPGSPAKVSVLSSGLMGSLSGSAVANTATTGTFTIPLMRSSGFSPHIAAGVEAAASSGGALVPPVMGAGAYMMLEIIDPPVTFLEIVRAALVPAILYYLSLFCIVHFHSRRIEARGEGASAGEGDGFSIHGAGDRWAGIVFVLALGSLIFFLLRGFTVFRAVSLALAVVLGVAAFRSSTRVGWRSMVAALQSSARAGAPLVSAAACVGIVIGIVTLTGVGTRLPSTILPLAQDSLPLALMLIMVSTLVLGMGLPSAVCYLLMATLIGPVLGDLGVVPLAAHLFIFYFGMMAMVTPPVALAAYAAGSIAKADVMRSGLAAFRFALVGFTLPYMFVFRPQLLLLDDTGAPAGVLEVIPALVVAVMGIVALAAGIAGWLRQPLSTSWRVLAFVAAFLLLFPAQVVGESVISRLSLSWPNVAGALLLIVLLMAIPGQRATTE